MTDHIELEQFCDLADGALDAATRASVLAHLSSCDECAGEFASLSALGTATAALPRSIAPPADLWNDIRAEIAPARVLAKWNVASCRVEQVAAAAIAIAVASSSLTVLFMRGTRTDVSGSVASSPTSPALPVALAREEAQYTSSVKVLVRTLAERRSSLAPATIATVEQSMRVADDAINEARDALARDPANRELVKLFASNYERKIDLLKRATALTPRT